MSRVSLDQVLIVDPQCSFHHIALALTQLGWQRDSLELSPPLLQGEPEVATWSWGGNKPFITYTFNPVVHMRVLEVATLPPALRSLLASKLPLLDHTAIAKLFDSADARERLLGLWCAQETETVDLLSRARQLTVDAEPVLAEQAQEVCERLERINNARKELLVQMNMMAEAAPTLIRRMNDRAFVQTLKPSREDLQQLFDEHLVAAAESAIETIYADPDLCLEHLISDIRIEVIASPAGLLRWPNLLSDKFPGGYRDIAGWMNPKRIWMCWKLLGPSDTCVSYDGLVWLDNKWLWLPKIFRYLTPFLFSQSLTKH
ncbi:MAG TPA: hypothetical protein VN030_03240 [Cellvibrio sp.]|nr:hypothetical protein [Cellvibrio sp.]